jgi:hypothetical protein
MHGQRLALVFDLNSRLVRQLAPEPIAPDPARFHEGPVPRPDLRRPFAAVVPDDQTQIHGKDGKRGLPRPSGEDTNRGEFLKPLQGGAQGRLQPHLAGVHGEGRQSSVQIEGEQGPRRHKAVKLAEAFRGEEIQSGHENILCLKTENVISYAEERRRTKGFLNEITSLIDCMFYRMAVESLSWQGIAPSHRLPAAKCAAASPLLWRLLGRRP